VPLLGPIITVKFLGIRYSNPEKGVETEEIWRYKCNNEQEEGKP